MSVTVAQITETDSHGPDVVIRAQSGDLKIEIGLDPQEVLSLISSLLVSRAEALKELGEPRLAYPIPLHRLLIAQDQNGEEFLRLYVSPQVFHDYQIPAIGQPAEALKNWVGRIAGKGQVRS